MVIIRSDFNSPVHTLITGKPPRKQVAMKTDNFLKNLHRYQRISGNMYYGPSGKILEA